MKRFKNVSFVLSAILLAGFVTFSACKKEDKVSGTQAAKELCDCLHQTGTALNNCLMDFDKKYKDYIGDYEELNFKDEAFGKDFIYEFAKCDFDFGEEDE